MEDNFTYTPEQAAQLKADTARIVAESAGRQLARLIQAAESKFGTVNETRTHPRGGTVLLIRRSEPANDSLPFMTIRGIISPGGNTDFSWGHYDLNETDAQTDFQTR